MNNKQEHAATVPITQRFAREVRQWQVDPYYASHSESTPRPGFRMPAPADGQMIASVRPGNTFRQILFDCMTGEAIREIGPNMRSNIWLRLSPDGRRALTLDWEENKEYVLWDAERDKKLRSFIGHDDTRYDIRWFPDSRRFATTARDAKMLIWDADAPENRPQPIAIIKNEDRGKGPQGMPGLDVFPDGNRVATGDAYGVEVWDVTTQRRIVQSDPVADPYYRRIDDTTIESITGAQGHYPVKSGPICAVFDWVVVSPDSKQIAGGAENGVVCVFDSASGKLLAKHVDADGFLHHVTGLAWSPNGEKLIYTTRCGSARVWEWQTGKLITCFQGNVQADLVTSYRSETGVVFVTFSPDGQQAITGRNDGLIQLWDVTD